MKTRRAAVLLSQMSGVKFVVDGNHDVIALLDGRRLDFLSYTAAVKSKTDAYRHVQNSSKIVTDNGGSF